MKEDKRAGSKCDKYKGQIVALLGTGLPVTQIYAELFPEGTEAEFTQDTLHKYCRKLKESASAEASEILNEHIRKTLPSDLAMLEDLQHSAYQNSKKYHTVRAERISAAEAELPAKIEQWRIQIQDGENIPRLIRWIIRECLNLLDSDDKRQEMALKHANLAISTVSTKFKTGLGEVESKGHIYINVTRPEEFQGEEKKGEVIPMVIKGGKNG
jgi:hypothetical protein